MENIFLGITCSWWLAKLGVCVAPAPGHGAQPGCSALPILPAEPPWTCQNTARTNTGLEGHSWEPRLHNLV